MSKNGRKIIIKSSRKKFQGECYLDVLETVEKISKDNPCVLIFKAGGTKPKVKTTIETNFCFSLGLAHQLG
jgi:hypothetical protein